MVSIPRDSYVPIPDNGTDKINAAFALGGAPLLAQTVEQATGLRLDHYAEIGFGGFARRRRRTRRSHDVPGRTHQRSVGRHRAAGRLPDAGRPQRPRFRPQPRNAARRPRPHGPPARVHVRSPAPGRESRRVGQPVALVLGAARPRSKALAVDTDDHIWDLARLGWALRGDTTTITVPIGEFGYNDSGDVVVWDHDAAGELFTALAADQPVPQSALDAQP